MMDHSSTTPDDKDASDDHWHAAAVEDVLEALKTTIDGLTQDEASSRLETYGPNRLPERERRSALVRFLQHFHNILIYVLLGSAAITAAMGHLIDTGVILAVVLANAIIGFIQEGKAEDAMAAIRRMLAPKASVVRGGDRTSVDGESLVPGDVVLLEAGDRVPADVRLLRSHGLQVQEAILTGESVPVDKGTEPVTKDAPVGDRSSMAFSGTLVTSGQGRGVVVSTGTDTKIGRISGLLATVEELTTPLVRQMNSFGRWLTVFILLIAACLLVYGYFVAHLPFAEMFMAVVGLSVAAIPEGLPAVLTITLAVGVRAMAKRNAIVRRLPAIETLGSVSVICTDKTGTLTRNEMMVSSVVTGEASFTVEGVGYEPHGAITEDGTEIDGQTSPLLETLGRTAVLCNDASLRHREERWEVEGDPMEGALLALAGKTELTVEEERDRWTRTDAIPFDAKQRFMATLDHDHEGHGAISVKGAPEQILEMCSRQRAPGGETEPIDRSRWERRAEAIASKGQRVLALAIKPVDPQQTVLQYDDVDELIMIGLVGLIDPPRPEAIEAVKECQEAGIRVKMITGDHRATATAIGRQVGLQNAENVLTGSDLDNMDDATLERAVLDTDIYARTSPSDKLRLVEALQSHDMTVAMTGDGVNDAPALKRADTGVAMGITGSEAAKEASEFVLTDDNFASIAAAVREGRTVYDNIKKVISWTLPTNGGEALIILVALLLGMTLPITPIQILWINLVTATTLGIALAFEPTEPNTMQRPPRPRNQPILTGDLVWHIVLVSVLFLFAIFGMNRYAIDQGYSIELARTLALNTLVVLEIFHLFFIRNIHGTSLRWQTVRGTKVVWLTVLVTTAAQFAVTYFPPLQRIFGTQAVPFLDGLLTVGVGVALLVLLETEKQLRLRIEQMRTP
jgi:magnesium-transporting ATPase (P-type)